MVLLPRPSSGAKSQRCSICSIDYPPFIAVCRVCGLKTWPLYKQDPQEDWEERVAELLGRAPSPYPHPPDLLMRIGFHHNRIWLSHNDLIQGGYNQLESGSIVFVNGRFYELEGYNWLMGEWWVEEVVVDGAADDLHPSMFERLDGGDG